VRRIAYLVAACLFACLAVAGGPAAHAQEWARKMFRETSHDFGTVAAGARAEHRFVVTNLFKETVHIQHASANCECVRAIVTRSTLHSRESAEVIAVLDTTNFKGQRNVAVTVTIDQPFPAQVQLRVAGFIRSDVVFSPGSVNFGQVRFGSKAERLIDVLYAGRTEWEIVDVRTANPHLEAELYEKRRGGGQVEYRMLVRLTADAPLGYLKDQLSIVTNDGQLARIPIDVEGKVESEVTVSPLPLVFGEVKAGEHVTKPVVVRGTRPFRITEVECDDCFEVQTPKEAKTYHLLRVTFRAQKSGSVAGRIHIKTDLGADVVPDIPAYGQVTDTP
jgi:hypothetical protein